MTTHSRVGGIALVSAMFAGLFFASEQARAGSDITWTGNGFNSDFNTPTNWTGKIVPGASDAAVFTGVVNPLDGLSYPSGTILLAPLAGGNPQLLSQIIVQQQDQVILSVNGSSVTLIAQSTNPGLPSIQVGRYVGDNAFLTLDNGLNVQARYVDVGVAAGTRGTLTLQGNANMVNGATPTDYTIGGTGANPGLGTLNAGGYLWNDYGTLHVTGNGTVNFSGGVIQVGTLTLDPGAKFNHTNWGQLWVTTKINATLSELNWTKREIRVGYDVTVGGPGGEAWIPTTLTGGQELGVGGSHTLTIASGTTFTLNADPPNVPGNVFDIYPATLSADAIVVQPGAAFKFIRGSMEYNHDLAVGADGLIQDVDTNTGEFIAGSTDLTITSDRALKVNATTTVRAGSKLVIDGGANGGQGGFKTTALVLEAAVLDTNGAEVTPAGQLIYRSGALGLGGDLVVGAHGTLGPGDVTLGDNHRVFVDGDTVIQDGAKLEVNGGALSTRSINIVSGTFQFTRGDLYVYPNDPAGVIVGVHGTLADGDLALGPGQFLHTGAITIRDGAKFTIDAQGNMWSAGVETSAITVESGSVDFKSGYLWYGTSLDVAPTALLGGNVTLDAQKALSVSGILAVKSGAVLTLDGGYLYASTLSVEPGGTLTWNGGSLSLGSGLTVGLGGPLGTNIVLDAGKSLYVSGSGMDVQSGGKVKLNGGALTVFTALHIRSGGTFTLNGGSLAMNGNVFNEGTLEVVAPAGTTSVSMSTVNDGSVAITGAGKGVSTLDYYGPFTNNRYVKTTGVTVRWHGPFTNKLKYVSDPSENVFEDLTIEPSGSLQGGAGDEFVITGSLSNHSTDAADWDTHGATLRFEGAGAHTFTMPDDPAFGWGVVELGSGATLSVEGGALYAGRLVLDDGLTQLGGITGQGLTVYLDPNDPVNAPIFANPELLGGANLAPIPEPASALVLVLGGGLALARRPRGRKAA